MPIPFARRSAEIADLEALIQLRLVAMRPSLEKAGRFNPTRARQRFIDEFSSEHTILLFDQELLVGCFALIPRENDLYLAHLYLRPEYQGQGIGGDILNELKARATDLQQDIVLTALSNSDAERFYARNGFTVDERGDIDVEMVWRSRSM